MFGVKCKRCASFGELWARSIVQVFIFAYFCRVDAALTIKHLYVPDFVNIKSSDAIKLECVLEYDADENVTVNELVAKWYLNNSLVYQWIDNRSPPYVNKTFADRLDLKAINPTHISGRKVSVPLVITKKAKDLTGWYRCQAETFKMQASDESYMKMYVPVGDIILDQEFDNTTNELSVTCGAVDVYPKPEITLSVDGEKNITSSVLDIRENANQLFDITATYLLPLIRLQAVTKINCSIALPDVSHISSKVTQYSKSGLQNVVEDIKVSEQAAATTGAADWSSKRISFKLLCTAMLAIVVLDGFVH